MTGPLFGRHLQPLIRRTNLPGPIVSPCAILEPRDLPFEHICCIAYDFDEPFGAVFDDVFPVVGVNQDFGLTMSLPIILFLPGRSVAPSGYSFTKWVLLESFKDCTLGDDESSSKGVSCGS